MQSTTTIILIASVVIIGAAMLFHSKKAVASDQDQVVQKMLIELTSNMKSYSENSEADFEYWANLNDALLGYITEYYNEDTANRFEATKDIIIEAEARLSKINSIGAKNEQQIMLEQYTNELETNKAKQAGTR